METQTTKSSNGSFQKTGPLSFIEAMKAINEGHKIKLPEWTGYWFVDKKEDKTPMMEDIRVMTKSGDILNDPWIEKYKDRDDWQITDGSLGFDWAINALKNGKKVKSKSIPETSYYIELVEAFPLTENYDKMVFNDQENRHVILRNNMILAEDWELAE